MSDQGAPGWHPPPADGWLPGGGGSGGDVLAPQGWQQPTRPPPPLAHASPPPPGSSQAGGLPASHRGGLVGTTTGQGLQPLFPQQVQQQQLSQQSAYNQAQLYHQPRAIECWPAASQNAAASGSRSSTGPSGRGYLAFSSPGHSQSPTTASSSAGYSHAMAAGPSGGSGGGGLSHASPPPVQPIYTHQLALDHNGMGDGYPEQQRYKPYAPLPPSLFTPANSYLQHPDNPILTLQMVTPVNCTPTQGSAGSDFPLGAAAAAAVDPSASTSYYYSLDPEEHQQPQLQQPQRSYTAPSDWAAPSSSASASFVVDDGSREVGGDSGSLVAAEPYSYGGDGKGLMNFGVSQFQSDIFQTSPGAMDLDNGLGGPDSLGLPTPDLTLVGGGKGVYTSDSDLGWESSISTGGPSRDSYFSERRRRPSQKVGSSHRRPAAVPTASGSSSRGLEPSSSMGTYSSQQQQQLGFQSLAEPNGGPREHKRRKSVTEPDNVKSEPLYQQQNFEYPSVGPSLRANTSASPPPAGGPPSLTLTCTLSDSYLPSLAPLPRPPRPHIPGGGTSQLRPPSVSPSASFATAPGGLGYLASGSVSPPNGSPHVSPPSAGTDWTAVLPTNFPPRPQLWPCFTNGSLSGPRKPLLPPVPSSGPGAAGISNGAGSPSQPPLAPPSAMTPHRPAVLGSSSYLVNGGSARPSRHVPRPSSFSLSTALPPTPPSATFIQQQQLHAPAGAAPAPPAKIPTVSPSSSSSSSSRGLQPVTETALEWVVSKPRIRKSVRKRLEKRPSGPAQTEHVIEDVPPPATRKSKAGRRKNGGAGSSSGGESTAGGDRAAVDKAGKPALVNGRTLSVERKVRNGSGGAKRASESESGVMSRKASSTSLKAAAGKGKGRAGSVSSTAGGGVRKSQSQSRQESEIDDDEVTSEDEDDLPIDWATRPFDHGPTDLPPRPYIGWDSPMRPKKPKLKIPGSAMDRIPAIEARLSALEKGLTSYIQAIARRSFRNSMLPGVEFPTADVEAIWLALGG